MKATSERDVCAGSEVVEPKVKYLFSGCSSGVIRSILCSVSELMPIIKGKTDTDAVIYSDGFKTYDGLVNYGYKKHYRVKHAENEFPKGDGRHINLIESFREYAKHCFVRFNGIPRDLFEIYLKKAKFRFNYRGEDLYQVLLKIFQDEPSVLVKSLIK